MSVPPYVTACVVCIGLGYAADRMRSRGVFQIGLTLVSMAGFTMLLASNNPNVKYGGTFLACIGIYANVPQCVVWTANNIGGSTKRSIGKPFARPDGPSLTSSRCCDAGRNGKFRWSRWSISVLAQVRAQICSWTRLVDRFERNVMHLIHRHDCLSPPGKCSTRCGTQASRGVHHGRA